MPAGMQVVGSHGVLQVDGEYRNLALRAKHSVLTTSLAPGLSPPSLTDEISISGISNPVVAVACDQFNAVWRQAVGSILQIVVSGPVGTPLTVYVFGEPPAAVSNYGLQVFNDSGQIVFDAARAYMRVVGHSHMSGSGGSDFNMTLPVGRSYAALVNGGSRFESQPGGGTYANVILRGMSRVVSNVVTFGVRTVNRTQDPFTIGTSPFQSAAMMAIDVTGL